MALLPDSIHTSRLLLRRWRPEDAAALEPVLAANVAHLEPWIPWSVAEPAPAPALAARLAGYAADFDGDRRWIYGIFPPEDTVVLGGIGLYPRDVGGRVQWDAATLVEIGYWLSADATGQGFATEATRAVLTAAVALPGITHVEIRCDPRNARSVAIPERLGFHHAHTLTLRADGAGGHTEVLMVWEHVIRPPARGLDGVRPLTRSPAPRP